MPQTRSIAALAVRTEPARIWTAELVQTSVSSLQSAGTWAVETAQQFGSLLSALLAPAVLSTYAFAAWSLASNLGWTNTFPYSSGPFSNWLIWAGIAILVHVAAHVLHRRTLER